MKASAARHSSENSNPPNSISPCAIGMIDIWPNDPPADAIPSAMGRRSSLTRRLMTPSTTENVVQLCARPIRIPAPSMIIIGSEKLTAT